MAIRNARRASGVPVEPPAEHMPDALQHRDDLAAEEDNDRAQGADMRGQVDR